MARFLAQFHVGTEIVDGTPAGAVVEDFRPPKALAKVLDQALMAGARKPCRHVLYGGDMFVGVGRPGTWCGPCFPQDIWSVDASCNVCGKGNGVSFAYDVTLAVRGVPGMSTAFTTTRFAGSLCRRCLWDLCRIEVAP